MGLLAAAFLVTMRMPDARERSGVQAQLARVLVPSLLPVLAVGRGHGVDLAAHVGGALSGAAWGGLLLWAWPRGSPVPGGRVAALVALLGVGCLGLSVVEVAKTYPELAAGYDLAPNDAVPRDDDEALKQLDALVAKYPKDPRVRFLQVIALDRKQDAAGAEALLRSIVSDAEHLKHFSPGYTTFLNAALAKVIARQGRDAEARAWLLPFCPAAGLPPRPEQQSAVESGLCPAN